MNKKQLIERIRFPEWSDAEFKEARTALPRGIWDTVSAFSNTDGGYIVLGIKEIEKDRFEAVGVESADSWSCRWSYCWCDSSRRWIWRWRWRLQYGSQSLILYFELCSRHI